MTPTGLKKFSQPPLGLAPQATRCLNPGVHVQRHGQQLRIGAGADWMVLDGIDDADHGYVRLMAARLFGMTPTGNDPDFLPSLERCHELDALLAPLLVAVPPGPEPRGARHARRPDLAHWSVAYEQHAGAGLMRRERAVVIMDSGSRIARAAADALLSAGVSTVALQDTSPVTAPDTVLSGIDPRHLGRERGREARRHLSAAHPRARILETAPVRPAGSPTPERDAHATVVLDFGTSALSPAPDSMVLPVWLGDGWATLGPFTLPGLTACLDCHEEALVEYHAARSPVRGLPQPAEAESSMALTLGGLAAMHVLMAIDAVNVPASAGRIVTVNLSTGGVEYDDVAPRPSCHCYGAVWREPA